MKVNTLIEQKMTITITCEKGNAYSVHTQMIALLQACGQYVDTTYDVFAGTYVHDSDLDGEYELTDFYRLDEQYDRYGANEGMIFQYNVPPVPERTVQEIQHALDTKLKGAL